MKKKDKTQFLSHGTCVDINFRECAIHSSCLFISLFIQLFFSSLLRKESKVTSVLYKNCHLKRYSDSRIHTSGSIKLKRVVVRCNHGHS